MDTLAAGLEGLAVVMDGCKNVASAHGSFSIAKQPCHAAGGLGFVRTLVRRRQVGLSNERCIVYKQACMAAAYLK